MVSHRNVAISIASVQFPYMVSLGLASPAFSAPAVFVFILGLLSDLCMDLDQELHPGDQGLNIRKCTHTVSVATLLGTVLVRPAAAQSANALLRDTNRQDVGTVSLLQTPAGVLLKLSLKGMPPGEHAPHIHAVGKRAAVVRFGWAALQSGQHAPWHYGGAWSCWRHAELAHSADRLARSRTG
jgi:hypothetical protein